MDKRVLRIISLLMACILFVSMPVCVQALTIPKQKKVESEGTISVQSAEIPDSDFIGTQKTVRTLTFSAKTNKVYTSDFQIENLPTGTYKIGYTGDLTHSITAQVNTLFMRAGIEYYNEDAEGWIPEYYTDCYKSSATVYETIDISGFQEETQYRGFVQNFSQGTYNGVEGAVSGNLKVFVLY